jgi:hypothetical protein
MIFSENRKSIFPDHAQELGAITRKKVTPSKYGAEVVISPQSRPKDDSNRVAVVRRSSITVGLCSIVPMFGALILHRFPYR